MHLREHPKSFPLYLIVFCAALFLSITISPPSFHFNDEWITANQLHQLGEGHQVITSEGKYGTFIGNQATEYFTTRANVLGYSLFFPILSLPVLFLFQILDHFFRFAVLITWATLPVIIAVLIMKYYPEYSRLHGVPWVWGWILITSFGFVWNLAIFYPFTADGFDDPIEAASLIFTDHILFACLTTTLLFICRQIFIDSFYSLFGTIALICSSSYIYWASSAKDHMLVALIFALILASLFIMAKRNDFRYAVFPFSGCGLLAWVRPELAFMFFLATICIYFWVFPNILNKFLSNRQLLIALLIPFSVLIGSVPFFINNVIITGDPLTPSYISMVEIGDGPITIENQIQNEIPIKKKREVGQSLTHLISVIQKYFQPEWSTFLPDTGRIFFAPISGMISIFAICPLFLIGISMLIIRKFFNHLMVKTTHIKEIIICLIAIFVVLISYINDFHGLNISEGIGPDLRYLSPLYIPGGLLGLITLKESFQYQNESSKLLKRTIVTILIATPILFTGILLMSPYGGGYLGYTTFISISVYFLSLGFLLFQIFQKYVKVPSWTNQITLALILSLPLTWNIILVIIFSVTRGNGYPFWLPVVERLFEFFIIPVG